MSRRYPLVFRSAVIIAAVSVPVALGIAAYSVGLFPGGQSFVRPWHVYVFENLAGPERASVVQEPSADGWQTYSAGSSSRLAILLTTGDSNWRGLAHGLKSLGVPFVVTDDWKRAVRHRVIMVYPIISGQVLSSEALQTIAAIPRRGGTLIGVSVLGGGLNEVFGFDSVNPSAGHTQIIFDKDHKVTAQFASSSELTIPVGSELTDRKLAGYEYTGTSNPPLAVYDNGTVAITSKPYAEGAAYAFGFDPGDFILKAHNRRLSTVAPAYANGYVSSVDVILRLIRGIYRHGEPLYASLSPVPDGKDLAVMLTHDIDYSRSLKNAVDYAKLEHQQGTPATHLVQTKYIKDWNDEIFFNDENIPDLKKLHQLGSEVGSHSVSHARMFDMFPLGTGQESYPDYRPFVKSQYHVLNGTILGELRISRYLLENYIGQGQVVTFRPGHLSNPESLPQALHATGYLYASSVTANVSLTHLPFRLNHQRGPQGAVAVFEFPVTVEDELPPELPERLDDAIELAKRIAHHGGIYVVLIHTDRKEEKLEFQKRLVESIADFSWFGTVADFGQWWSARDLVDLDVKQTSSGAEIVLVAPRRIDGLVLEIAPGMNIVSADTDLAFRRIDSRRVVLGSVSGRATLQLSGNPGAR